MGTFRWRLPVEQSAHHSAGLHALQHQEWDEQDASLEESKEERDSFDREYSAALDNHWKHSRPSPPSQTLEEQPRISHQKRPHLGDADETLGNEHVQPMRAAQAKATRRTESDTRSVPPVQSVSPIVVHSSPSTSAHQSPPPSPLLRNRRRDENAPPRPAPALQPPSAAMAKVLKKHESFIKRKEKQTSNGKTSKTSDLFSQCVIAVVMSQKAVAVLERKWDLVSRTDGAFFLFTHMI